MEQVIMMAMQTCQNYAEKMTIHALTEFEVLMYEQLCNFVHKYAQIQQLCLDSRIRHLTREDITEKAEYQKWLENNNGGDGEATAV